VQHYAPTHDLTHHWRTRTLIVSAIAGVELVALIAVGIAVLGKGWLTSHAANAAKQRPAHHATKTTATKPTPPTAKPHHTAPAKPMLANAQTGVLVLNGNGRNGAAGAEAGVLRAHGYPVTAVGNAKRNDYAGSIVMYRPGYAREARRLAQELGIPIVSTLDGLLTSQLKGARLTLIVGR
jgi:hypothetical protein